MADEDLDADLQDLLNQLDDQDEFLPTSDELAGKVEKPVVAELSKEKNPAAEGNGKPTFLTGDEPRKNSQSIAPITGNGVALRPVDELVPTDHRRMDTTSSVITSDDAINEGDDNQLDLTKYLDQIDGVTKEVLQACRSDRQEAQDVINMLRRQVDDAHNKGQSPSRMYVDGLVKSVEVKAGINATAVKMMEGVGKMLAATRAGITVQNNNLTVTGSDLDEMLSQDVSNDLD